MKSGQKRTGDHVLSNLSQHPHAMYGDEFYILSTFTFLVLGFVSNHKAHLYPLISKINSLQLGRYQSLPLS